MKRILKIVGIILLVLIILLVATPFLFRGKLEDLLKNTINQNINARVTWEALDISLIKNFPDATVTLNDFSVINNAPFEGDTLAAGKELRIAMGIKQLLKDTGDDPIKIDALRLDDAIINIKVDSLGNANYDIAKKDSSSDSAVAKEDTSSKPFAFDLQHYELNNATINYLDESTKTYLRLSEMNHEGNGDFSASQSTLETKTTALASFEFDSINYLDNANIDLTADIALDLENQKYTFLENKVIVHELPLQFDGYVQLEDKGTAMDISFETPSSDFKNFLAIIPKAYATSLDGVQTGGDFRVSGKINGNATETTIPKLDIAIVSTNASFKYPDLPKQMNNINIDAKIKNDSGIVEDTYVSINTLNFKIDNDLFSANGKLRNLTTNILVNLAIKGTLDLANIGKVYPLDIGAPLQGKVIADMTTAFDMNAVNKQQYQRIESSGQAQLTDFKYEGEELPKPITIDNAALTFKPGIIQLENFEGQSGDTDIKANGTIENLIPFVMSKEDLKGRFNVTSQVFNLNDFSVTETIESNTPSGKNTSNTPATTKEATIQIPDFLDASLDFTATKVIYDDLELSDVKGTVAINDEKALLNNVNSSIFGGTAGVSGNVSTKTGIPIFDMELDLSKINIDQSFKNIKLLKQLAPIAKALQGSLNTKINLKGQLDENFAPILSSIDGNAFAEILTADVQTANSPLLSALNSQLDFINLESIDLDNLKAALTFKDGKVVVNPFTIKADDIDIDVSGGHSFDNAIGYNLKLDIPAKYLGGDVSKLLAKLTAKEKENLSAHVPITLSGNFTKPSVQLNLKSAIGDLTNQIIEIQKNRLIEEGTSQITDILGDVLGGGKDTPKDSTSTSSQGSPKPKVEDIIENAAGGLLDGLFGKKKKKTKKDSVGN
ncbi:AsmA-like C-terminal region-containing protein [uncultured Dokdonia sp.]|uniref:AsmA-like C-terminal region-containing protein n=1 Tax=uncultured Dokdonia sp. TaxID=575653 RepID=UPI002618F6C6|nr:AsmA-like C-terminal region-containing protein [uncultured Dokdonia sp.]